MPLRVFGTPGVVEGFFESNAVGIKRPKAIWFKHGVLSPGAYINNRVLPSHHAWWRSIMSQMAVQVETLGNDFDVIASVATGGTPHGVALALKFRAPHFSVKKAEKGHGVAGLVDGDLEVLRGKRVLLVEDMSSTFKSSLKAIRALEHDGAKVVHTIMLNAWGLPEFHANIADHSVHVLCTGEMIVDFAAKTGKLDSGLETVVRHWLQHPEDESWSEKDGWVVPPKPASVSDD